MRAVRADSRRRAIHSQQIQGSPAMTTRNKITSSIIKAAFALLLAASPAFAMQGHGVRAVEQFAFAAVASRDVIVYQGQAVNELLTATGLETSGRGLRAHIRTATPAATVIQILTYNGASNARVAFDGSAGVRMTIGAGVSALWLVGADRTEWVYDVESYSLSDVDDVIVTHRGKFIVYGNRTRESDVTPSAQMPSGDGRYVRFDTDAQGLSDAQKLAARTNIGAGTGGGGAGTWGSITGTLTDQTDLTSALALKAPLASPTFTGTPAAPTAAFGTSTTQIATTAFVGGEITTHAGATDPHGDRAFATAADSTHSALTTGAHGITAAGAALLDDATAADQRTTLGLGTAATQASSAFEASGAVSTHNAVTTAHGISAYGATLVDDADAATARTTLGLGTAATSASGDFAAASHNQAASTITSGTLVHERGGLEADVSAYSGLVKIAAGATSAVTVTAAGEALLDDADASAQRTTLGLGTAATTAATDYATAAQGTDDRTASGLRSASTVVSVSAATAPSSGQVLTATSSTAATWQTPSGGGGSPAGSSGQMQYNNASAFGAANFWRESADIIAQRNSTTAQTLYVYDTYTDSSNYGRLALNTNLTGDWLQIAVETAGTGADNYGLALTPSGTGAISAQVPDSGTGGGNARGARAVDWSTLRGVATAVASGSSSVVSGGYTNTASGAQAFVGAGHDNTASGAESVVVGGSGGTASAANATVGGGVNNTATQSSATVAGGSTNAASGIQAAIGGGISNTASGTSSWIPGGRHATTRGLWGAFAYSAGQRSAQGDAQVIGQPVRRTTTDATPVSLATDGTPAAATVMVLPASSTLMCSAMVVAQSASAANNAGYEIKAVIQRDGSNNTALVGTATTTTIGEDTAGMDATIIANDTLESAEIQVTGVAATTIQWAGELKCVQVL